MTAKKLLKINPDTHTLFALLLAAVLAFFVTLSVRAAPIPWKNKPVHYSVESKPLKDVLRDFTASQGIPAAIAPSVDGTVTGKFDLPPQEFLNTLASSFGFVWYYDGSLLDISSANDVKSIVLTLRYASMDELRTTLDRLGLADSRYPVVYDDTQHTAVVSGPPHYLQLVSNVAQGMDSNASQLIGTQIRLFKLHHAWAADHDIEISGKTVRMPGVASVLSSLFDRNPWSNAASPPWALSNLMRLSPLPDVNGAVGPTDVNGAPVGDNSLLPPLPSNFGRGATLANGPLNLGNGGGQTNPSYPSLPPLPNGLGGPGGGGQPNAMMNSANFMGNSAEALPVIKADTRTNSVLIRDLPGRMDQYMPLIEALDVKPRLIEIEANIIEVDDNALQQLGIDWRAHNSHLDFQIGNGKNEQAFYNGVINPHFGTTALGSTVVGAPVFNATPNGASLTAVLGDAGRFLLARINALEQTNQARIEASPKVTTLDNIEAVMDNRKQIFVRVDGFFAGNLYSISTGVLLRVLPMVVEENNETQIKLEVSIDDGEFSDTRIVDQIPLVDTSQIKTQAFITQGQSLLIAGYRKNQNNNNISGVPLLSKIPILGALFRFHDTSQTRKEQLFLLSPRIIDL